MAPWESQFERLKRALRKVKRGDADATTRLDDLFTFFQHCWHLKDWTKNDDTVPKATRKAVVKDVEAADRLLYCADLANGSKHLHLDKSRKGATIWRFKGSTSDPKTGKVFSGVEGFGIASRHGTPQPYDIVEFAVKVVEDWVDILKKHGLR
jgi:hypothetical protein